MSSDDSPSPEESVPPQNVGGEDDGANSGGGTEKEQRPGPMLSVGIFTALGFELAAFIFVGLYVGNWLDEWAGTSPLFLLVLLMLAGTAAGWHIYRIAERYL